mmetsp:Transcript_4761/g.6978  ORF Transcript_4761/g.6978 Transcript_4761/m.6978 type:complete len:222 (+) Transcript_4761:255-920(+)
MPKDDDARNSLALSNDTDSADVRVPRFTSPSMTRTLSFDGGITRRTLILVCRRGFLSLSLRPSPHHSAWKNFQLPPAARCWFSTSRIGPPAVDPSILRIRFSLELGSPVIASNISSSSNIGPPGDEIRRQIPIKCSSEGKGGIIFFIEVSAFSAAIVLRAFQFFRIGLSSGFGLFFFAGQFPVAIGLAILLMMSVLLSTSPAEAAVSLISSSTISVIACPF